MSSRQRPQTGGADDPAGHGTGSNQSGRPVGPGGGAGAPAGTRARMGVLIVAIVLVCVVVILADFIFGAIANLGGGSAQTATPAASPSQLGFVIQGRQTQPDGGVLRLDK